MRSFLKSPLCRAQVIALLACAIAFDTTAGPYAFALAQQDATQIEAQAGAEDAADAAAPTSPVEAPDANGAEAPESLDAAADPLPAPVEPDAPGADGAASQGEDPEQPSDAPAPEAPAAPGDAPAPEAPEAPAQPEDDPASELPATQAAASSVHVSNFKQFDAAMKDAQVSMIICEGSIAPGLFDGPKQYYDVTRNLHITGNDAALDLICFTVKPGATLKLSGTLRITCDTAWLTAMDVVDVYGTLEVSDNVSLHTDNGLGGIEHGYGVRVRDGGYADIHTSGNVRGSSGGVLVDRGGRAQIYGDGTYQSENATGYDDSGNVGVNTGSGRMPVDNYGTLTVFGYPRIQGIGTEEGATTVIRGGTFQNTGVEQNTNPSFVNNGTVYLSGCTIGTGMNKKKNLIFSKTSRTLILSSSSQSVNIEGFVLNVEAPTVTFDYDEHALKVSGPFSQGMTGFTDRSGLYQSNIEFRDLRELVANPDAVHTLIEGTQVDESQGVMSALEAPGTPSFTSPYVFSMLQLADGHNFGGKPDVLNDGGEVLIFGPTAPLSNINVDVNWGSLAFQVEGTWNPDTHQYENQTITAVSDKQRTVSLSANPRSTRPVSVALDVSVLDEFASSMDASYDDGAVEFYLKPGDRAQGALALAQTAPLDYFDGTKVIGRAKATVTYATTAPRS